MARMGRDRLAWLAPVVTGAGAAVVAACTGGSSTNGGDLDASTGVDAGPTDATHAGDSAGPQPETGADARHGGCEPTDGACDLVLQSCPSGQQCSAVPSAGGGFATSCGPTFPVQHIQAGYACCPSTAPGGDPCLPGQRCVGDVCAGDAGGGRCAPFCCAGDDTPCGASPEGFPGHCDISIVDDAGAPLYDVCDYAPPCRPLGLLPCPSGYACLVQDTSGGAHCVAIYNGGGAGAAEGAPCKYDNSCADGLMCLTDTGPDGGIQAVCLMLCSTGQGSPPFDAGALGMQPGTGACDPGKHCVGAAQIFPPWLGVCL